MTDAWRRALLPLLLAGLVAGCSQPAGDAVEPPEESGSAETVDFTLPDLEGNPVKLADFRGRTVIVDFWATWCPPCLFQVPELNEFWKTHKDSGDVMVIGVAVDVEGAEVVAPWAEEQGVVYQLVIGSEDVARAFGAVGFPTLVIVRPDGTIDSRHVGLVEVKDLETLVAAARGTGAT